jgi:NADPH-dependent glutamate synthase beta subunit-like oxidoreductase
MGKKTASYGGATVILAMYDGKTAAAAMHKYMMNPGR